MVITSNFPFEVSGSNPDGIVMSKTPSELEQYEYSLVEKTCKACGKKFYKSWSKWTLSIFCSKSCSKSFSTRDKRQSINHKVSNKLKKTINGNSKEYEKRKSAYAANPKRCPVCSSVIPYEKRRNSTCSFACGVKLNVLKHKECGFYDRAGGVRHGSGRGKMGWYKGYWCDSTWELAYVIYNLDHKIEFKRNTLSFSYIWKGKVRSYYPDFILPDGTFIEIKGYVNEQTKEKIKQFPYPDKLKLLCKPEMITILAYVTTKYGKNFHTLYESNKGMSKA